jgi:hypothetical protein
MSPEDFLQSLSRKYALDIQKIKEEENLKSFIVRDPHSRGLTFQIGFDNRGQLWYLDIDGFDLRYFNSSELRSEDINSCIESLVSGAAIIQKSRILRKPFLRLKERNGWYDAKVTTGSPKEGNIGTYKLRNQ